MRGWECCSQVSPLFVVIRWAYVGLLVLEVGGREGMLLLHQRGSATLLDSGLRCFIHLGSLLLSCRGCAVLWECLRVTSSSLQCIATCHLTSLIGGRISQPQCAKPGTTRSANKSHFFSAPYSNDCDAHRCAASGAPQASVGRCRSKK